MYIYICTYLNMHVHTYIYTYMYMHKLVYVCIYIHTYLRDLPQAFGVSNQNSKRCGRMRAFQNGSARTCSDADAAHLRKAPGVMQMRQTREMQMSNSEDACIRN